MSNDSLIPAAWRQAVVAILRTEDDHKILFTFDGRNQWQARFPDAWPFQLWQALIVALADEELEGQEITDMAEGYETWEFFFYQSGVRLYGKIGLHPDALRIKIYSAHPPRKGNTL
jgi:hypothetical protein